MQNSIKKEQYPLLKELFKNDFYLGTALNQEQVLGFDTNSLYILKNHFNAITAENIMKWDHIHPKPNEYNFELADKFVELGEKNKMFIVGHVLVWQEQTPAWVFLNDSGGLTDRKTLLQRMHDHINSVMTRYKGRVNCWDVVNEALDDEGNFKKNKWVEIIGEDFVQKAFEYANEADPEAELIYNDYSLNKPAKRAGVVRLIRDLQAKGIKVDGVGEQGHYQLDYPEIKELEESILAFSQLGVKVMITEMDIDVLPFPEKERGADISLSVEFQNKFNPYTESLPGSVQQLLAKRYAEFFEIFLKHRDKISRVTIWGIHDGQSWCNNWPIKGRTNYPLLFDREYNPKPALDSIIKLTKKSE
jgi:endo-1,4-beta-xylanase